MRSWRARGLASFLVVLAVIGILFALLPGEHRLLCPPCFGMQGIGDRVYVEATKAAGAAPNMLAPSAAVRRMPSPMVGTPYVLPQPASPQPFWRMS